MALTPFDMEGVNRDLLAAGNPAKPDMQSILRRNARDLVWGNAILVSSVDAKELEFGVHMAYSDADGGFDTDPSEDVWFEASSLPIPNERPDLPPDNALRIRADRVAGVADVIGSDAFADEMRRFLPAGLMTSTVESPRWSAWAIEQIGTLYGTPGTPSSADAVPGFPIFGASNDSSPTR